MNRAEGDHHGLMDLGTGERPRLPAKARISAPIVPRSSIAGRALVAVVAIMTFLASLTTGAVLLVRASAAEWQSDVASEITIQLRPVQGRDMDKDVGAIVAAVRSQPGIVSVRPFSAEESAKAGSTSRACAVASRRWRRPPASTITGPGSNGCGRPPGRRCWPGSGF
jgi:cell division transport system permease protein